MVSFQRSVGAVVLAYAVSASAFGCAGAKAVEAKSPQLEPTPTASSVVQGSMTSSGKEPVSVAVSADIRRTCGIRDDDAYFAFDSANLDSSDVSTLNKVASCFVTGPLKAHSMRLIGRADPRGPSDYNMTLGVSRADGVSAYLTTHGMGRSKVLSTSRGAMDAVGTNETGWAHDRRVDLMLAQ